MAAARRNSESKAATKFGEPVSGDPPAQQMAATNALSESEYVRQASELASFRRMLVASRETFSVSFAVCTNRTLRDGLIGQLCSESPGIRVVALPADTTDVYDTVRARVAERSAPIVTRSVSEEPSTSESSLAYASGFDEPPTAIFVTELEPLLPADSADQPVLASLNLSREMWEKFNCPVVFWLAEYAAVLVATKAADLWRYRSHHFEFVSAAATPAAGMIETFGGYDMLAGLPYEQKRFRMAELEQRIEDAGPEPSAALRPHLVDWTYELAKLYQIFGKYDQSEQLLRHVLAIQEQAHGPDSPEFAVALNNLAQLLQATNRLAEAEPLMRRVVEILEQSVAGVERSEPPGDDDAGVTEASTPATHPQLATALNNLAGLLQNTNRLAEAEPLIRRALDIDESFYGTQHPSVARDFNNLAMLLKATNRLAEAEPLIRRALDIDERVYGAEHPEVATDLNNLAQLLKETNRLAQAGPLMRRALAMCRASLGDEHPNTQTVERNLKRLRAEMEEGEKASETRRR